MVPRGCPETSVSNYHFSRRNSPGERSSPLLRGESLKSCTIGYSFLDVWVQADLMGLMGSSYSWLGGY